MRTTIFGKEITLDDDLAEQARLHGLRLDDESIARYIKVQNAHGIIEGNALIRYVSADKKKLFDDNSEEKLSEDLMKYVENYIMSTREMKDW